MNSFEMEITPAQAKEFLNSNTENRKVRASWVAALSDIIRRGEWKVTHQGIALDSSHRLIDGQHRLLAIIEAGIPVRMVVNFDCDPSSFEVIDGGVKRSTADHLRISSKEAAVAAVLHRIGVIGFGVRGAYTHIAPDQTATVMRICGDEVRQVCVGKNGGFGMSPIRAAVVVHMMAGDLNAFESYTLMRQLELEHLQPITKAFAKQVIEGKIRGIWEMAGRAWRAFHPSHAESWRLQIKDISNPLAEMKDAYQRAAKTRQEEKSAPPPSSLQAQFPRKPSLERAMLQ